MLLGHSYGVLITITMFNMGTIRMWSQHNTDLDSMIDTTGFNVFIRYCKIMFDN